MLLEHAYTTEYLPTKLTRRFNLLHWSVGFIYFPAFVVFVDLLPMILNSMRT